MEDMLSQRNMESFLFRGKKISQQSNADKLDQIVVKLIEEEEKRKKSSIPIVVIKQAVTCDNNCYGRRKTMTRQRQHKC